MKILILGTEGMLGHQIYKTLVNSHNVLGFVKSIELALQHKDLFDQENLVSGFNIEDKTSLKDLLIQAAPDIVINAVGFIKQRDSQESILPSIKANSLLPLELSKLTNELGFKLICFSTDCVFSGTKGMYSELDTPDPVDQYGISKLIGEKIADNCLVLRTSFYGLELNSTYGLIEWFLSQKKSIKGYSRAIYSGLPTSEIAKILSNIIDNHPTLSGLWNVSSDPINKFELLSELNKNLNNRIEIAPDDSLSIDRSLDSTRFREFMNYHPPSWIESLDGLAKEIKERELNE